MAPQTTPRPVTDKLRSAFTKMMDNPSFTAMIKKLEENFYYLGPDETNRHHPARSFCTNGGESFGSPYEK